MINTPLYHYHHHHHHFYYHNTTFIIITIFIIINNKNNIINNNTEGVPQEQQTDMLIQEDTPTRIMGGGRRRRGALRDMTVTQAARRRWQQLTQAQGAGMQGGGVHAYGDHVEQGTHDNTPDGPLWHSSGSTTHTTAPPTGPSITADPLVSADTPHTDDTLPKNTPCQHNTRGSDTSTTIATHTSPASHHNTPGGPNTTTTTTHVGSNNSRGGQSFRGHGQPHHEHSVNPREAAYAATMLHSLGPARSVAEQGADSALGLQRLQALKLLGILVEQAQQKRPRLSFGGALKKVCC